MTRDEILSEIKRLSEQPVAYGSDLAYNMRQVARLADAYPDHADSATLAEHLADAHESFADKVMVL